MTPPTHKLRAHDGWSLDVAEVGDRHGPGAVVIAGHAMMVDRRTLLRRDRPCVARTLAQHGHLVLVPDLRGHGRSGPRAHEGGDWTYDQLVSDVGSYLDLADQVAPGRPVILLGHSLFGHNALAHVALHPRRNVCAMVLLAVDVWQPANEPSILHRAAKLGMLAASSLAVRAVGRLPARRMRMGTADEPAGYWRSLSPLNRRGWRADDGVNYQAALPRVGCPVLHVVSRGDRLYARPTSALNFTRGIKRREAMELGATGEATLDSLRPSHMGLVTDPACEPLWERVAGWIDARTEECGRQG